MGTGRTIGVTTLPVKKTATEVCEEVLFTNAWFSNIVCLLLGHLKKLTGAQALNQHLEYNVIFIEILLLHLYQQLN